MTIGSNPANLHLDPNRIDSQNASVQKQDTTGVSQTPSGQTVGIAPSEARRIQEANYKYLQANNVEGPMLTELSKLAKSLVANNDIAAIDSREVQNYKDFVVVMKADIFSRFESIGSDKALPPSCVQIEQTTLPEDIDAAVQDILELSKNTTVESCQSNIEKLSAAIEKLDPNDPNFTALQSFTGQVLNYATNRLMSLETMELLKADIEGPHSEPEADASLRERMEAFAERRTEWKKIEVAERPSADATQTNELVSTKGCFLMPDEAQQLRSLICGHGAPIVRALIPDDSPFKTMLSEKACGMIAGFALESGMPLNEATELICKALEGAKSLMGANDITTVENLLSGILNAKTPSEKSQAVDLLFAHSYPENADVALTLKQSLCPYAADRDCIARFHNYSMAMRTLMVSLQGDSPTGKQHVNPALMNTSVFLDAKTAESLLKQNGIDGFKFHLAHIAMLQAECIMDGTLALPTETNQQGETVIAGVGFQKAKFDAMPPGAQSEFLRGFADLQLRNWSETLQLDDYVKDFKAGLGGTSSPTYLDKLNSAVTLYNQGLEGETQFKQVEKNIAQTSSMTKRAGAHSIERGMLRTNLRSVAMEALDRHIQHITGESDPNKRIYGEESLQKNGAAIDKRMQEKVGKLLEMNDLKKTALLQGNDAELEKLNDYRDQNLLALKGCRRNFLGHVKTLEKMSRQTQERTELRSSKATTQERLTQMKLAYHQVASALPHQKADRTAVCRTVREIVGYSNALSKLENQLREDPENAKLLAQKTSLESRIDESLKQLKGVDIHTMRHSLKKADAEKTPTLDDVLRDMAPRADAILYFVDGRAKIDGKQIGHMKNRIQADTKSIKQLTKKTQGIYGKDTLRELKNVVNASILKVAATAEGQINRFSVYDKDTQAKVREQLKTWGLDVQEGSFLDHIMSDCLLAVSKQNGRLNMKALSNLLKVKTNTDEVDESINKQTFQYIKQHHLDIDQFDSVRSQMQTKFDEARYDLRRQEGVHNLFSELKKPGDTFSYSRQKGGAIRLNPLSDLFEKIGIPGAQVNVILGMLRDDSIAVTKGEDGKFQVLMKTDKAKELAATFGVILSASKLKLLTIEEKFGVQRGKAQGVSLTFPDQKSCEQFMVDFLNPKSDTHKTGSTEHSWRDSVDIQLHTGTRTTTEATAHIGAFLTKRGIVNLLNDKTISESSVSTTYNAHGAEHTFKYSYIANTNLDSSGKKIKSSVTTVPIDTTLVVRENENGLSPETSYTFSFQKSDLLLKEGLVYGNLNPSQIALMQSHPEQFNAMGEAWNKLGPGDQVSIRFDINPSALERCKTLRTQMNIALSGSTKNAIDSRSYAQLKEEYDSILMNPASYHAKEVKLTSTPKPDYSGGKDIVVVRRTSSLSHTNTESFDIPTS